MNNLIPYFIEQKYLKKEYSGDLKAFTMFIDIPGFTALTENLMKQGREGAEVLNRILNKLLEFLIDAVYNRGGFITTFAGDAFTAVFPIDEDKDDQVNIIYNGISSAISIRSIFEEKGFQSTRFGNFELFVKIGLSFGRIRWGIVGFEEHRAYYFRGEAIDGCAFAENKSKNMQIILDEHLYKQIENVIEIQKIDKEYYQLLGIKFNETEKIKGEISHISEEVAGVFLPKEVVKYKLEGELRDVVSVFLSFKEPLEFSELSTITSSFLKKADTYGGYFAVSILVIKEANA